MKKATNKIAQISKSFDTHFQTYTIVHKTLEKGTEKKSVLITSPLLVMCLLFVFTLNVKSQTEIVAPVGFNIELGQPITNDGGLTVSAKLISWHEDKTKLATLDGTPEKTRIKGVFELDITIQNNGANEIAIYDWSFKAICPKNVHGQEWQANTGAPQLTTAYIPSSVFIVLKPGDKKKLRTAPSDFYWCMSPDESSLLVKPRFLTAKIICGIINPKKYLSNFNPNMQQLIQTYWTSVASGKMTEAKLKRQEILDIGSKDYPGKKQELLSLLGETATGENAKKKLGTIPDGVLDKNNKVTNATGTIESTAGSAENNSVYSDWLTIKNPYYAMQIRYKLEKQEGDIGYFKTQMRIDFEDKDRCKDERCLGYAVCFGYPDLVQSGYIYLHYKFYFSYKEIYTMPNLLPIKISFSNGSQTVLKKDGFYTKLPASNQEVDARYLFDKSADLILTGSPLKFNNFIESKAVTLQ